MDISNVAINKKLELAFDSKTSSDILLQLANDKTQGLPGSYDETYALRRNVAGNPNAPLSLLERLAEDIEFEVRLEVAKNPSITQEMMESLSKEDDYIAAVASNKNCPPDILQKFSKIKDEGIREAVAANPNCPLALIKKWAKEKDDNIRACIASNPSSPIDVLEGLAADNESSVRTMVALNPSCPSTLLAKLSEDEDSEVRRCVAQSEFCPPEILYILEKDPEETVLIALASNSRLTTDIMARMASHTLGAVRIAAAQNSSISADLRESALTIPPCSIPGNNQLPDVMYPVSEINSLIEKAKKDHPAHNFFNHSGLKDIKYCAPAWGLKLLDLPTPYADRTRSMLEGPFFSSKEHPWPTDGNKKYASPIVQIDLREISKLKGDDYGDGLLQVFAFGTELLNRVIPRADVDVNKLTPSIPEDESELSSEFTHNYWLGYGGIVYQIIGFEEPLLSANVDTSEGAPNNDEPKIIRDIYKKMRELSMNDVGIHMFGTFYPIQYRHSEIGGELFMALDSSFCYSWGDSGNAQIFSLRSKDGSVKFHTQWSC